jgi:hypothetical protein
MEKGFGIGLAIVTVTVALFVAVGVEVALLPSYHLLPPYLPLPSGTVIHLRWTYGDPAAYHFNVTRPEGRLVGSWVSNGEVGAMVLPGNATTPIVVHCPALPIRQLGPPSNGTFNDSLVLGLYTVAFVCVPGEPDITVTQSIQVLYA